MFDDVIEQFVQLKIKSFCLLDSRRTRRKGGRRSWAIFFFMVNKGFHSLNVRVQHITIREESFLTITRGLGEDPSYNTITTYDSTCLGYAIRHLIMLPATILNLKLRPSLEPQPARIYHICI